TLFPWAQVLLAAVDEVEDEGDRHDHDEDDADEQRHASQGDQRRPWTSPLLGLALERLRRLDRMLDGVHDVPGLLDGIHHAYGLPGSVIGYARALRRARGRRRLGGMRARGAPERGRGAHGLPRRSRAGLWPIYGRPLAR